MEHIYSGFHLTQDFADRHNLESRARDLPVCRTGLGYYMLGDILVVVHILHTVVHQLYIAVLQYEEIFKLVSRLLTTQ